MPTRKNTQRATPTPDAAAQAHGFHTIEETEPVEGPGTVEPVRQDARSALATEPVVPRNSTMRGRRAHRIAREREHGTPHRRRLALKAGDDADNDFTLTATNDDDRSQT